MNSILNESKDIDIHDDDGKVESFMKVGIILDPFQELKASSVLQLLIDIII